MKRILLLSIIAALLGGCAVGPIGYGDRRDAVYRERNYDRDEREWSYGTRYGYYENRGYVGGWGDQGDPFRQQGQ